MFVFVLPEGGQMFAGKLPNTPGMFAWGFAIFLDKLIRIARLKGARETRISRISARVKTEFRINTPKQAKMPVAEWVCSRPDTRLIGRSGVRFERVAEIAAKMGAQTSTSLPCIRARLSAAPKRVFFKESGL